MGNKMQQDLPFWLFEPGLEPGQAWLGKIGNAGMGICDQCLDCKSTQAFLLLLLLWK